MLLLWTDAVTAPVMVAVLPSTTLLSLLLMLFLLTMHSADLTTTTSTARRYSHDDGAPKYLLRHQLSVPLTLGFDFFAVQPPTLQFHDRRHRRQSFALLISVRPSESRLFFYPTADSFDLIPCLICL